VSRGWQTDCLGPIGVNRKPPKRPTTEERKELEKWVRYRLRMADEDPWQAMMGAVARLTANGIDRNTAIQTVARIMWEEQQRHSPTV